MYFGSPSSVTHAENCAESATTLAPHTAATVKSSAGCAPNRKPTTTQHAPLTTIAAEVTTVRPTLSASRPATTHPTAPAPMTTNEAASASDAPCPRAERLARIITGAQVHIAYSSHM